MVVLAFPARPPSDYDTITGPIANPAGTVVPNAAVEIRNEKAGAVYQAGRRSRQPTTATRNLRLDDGLRSNSRLIWQQLLLHFLASTPNSMKIIWGAAATAHWRTSYPFAFDPRLGVAYQLNSRTVLRSGPVFRATSL